MRIETCYFCGGPVYPGHGIMFVRNDAKCFRFCKSKCHRHFKAKHNPRKMKWTKAYRKTAGKELAMDTSFDFEKKRNRPLRYDRTLVQTTLKVMKRVSKIQQRRHERFYERRMRNNQTNETAQGLKEILHFKDRLPLSQLPRKFQLQKLATLHQKKQQRLAREKQMSQKKQEQEQTIVKTSNELQTMQTN
eukprot:TRINITY_DN287_c0_g1_i3.p1 TRINITY_DN287_c0_g1~~TRINITY_DN287_c0_g1_i3.p1  ORF type:complete len:190 (-),score=79.36 TRINITY_DN287_c0_g1_i3:115-684(-)